MFELLQGRNDRGTEAAARSLDEWLRGALYRSGSCESLKTALAVARPALHGSSSS